MTDFDSYSFFDGTSMTPVTQITWAEYWKGVIPDGCVAHVDDEMKPYANSTGMYVYVSPGACFADNHRGVVRSTKQLPVGAAHATRPRIDLLVARVLYGNENESKIVLDVKQGTAAIDPVPPTLEQSTGSTYEIKLAEIYVAPAVVTLTPDAVTDFRNVFECGQQAFAFMNSDVVPLEKGMVVKLDGAVEGGIKRCESADLPIGVVESEYITVGAFGQVNTRPGNIAEVKCDEKVVSIGDALTVGTTAGLAETGGTPYYAAGLALAAKAAGVIGNVKSLLTIFSKIPYQNSWYLVDGISEKQVLAAYRFVGRKSAAEAMININQGAEYALEPKADSILWDTESGFYFPAAAGAQLSNESLATLSSIGLTSKVSSAAFGYSIESVSRSFCGGIVLDWSKSLVLRGLYLDAERVVQGIGYPAISKNNSNIYRGTKRPTSGVLGGTWNTNPNIYSNGEDVTNTTAISFNYNYDGVMPGGIGQPDVTYPNTDLIPFYMTAVVFYSTKLSAAQHLQLSDKIAGLGGFA